MPAVALIAQAASASSRQHGTHAIDLLLIDAVTHARIDAFDDLGAERRQRARRFLHACQRNMAIVVTTTEKYRRASKRALIVPRRAFGTDQAGAEADHSAIAPGVTCGVLERQTSALGEAEKKQPFGGKSGPRQPGNKLGNRAQRLRQRRLVVLERCQERVGIPGAAACLRGAIGEVGNGEQLGEREDILGRAAASVQHDHGAAGLRQRRAGLAYDDVVHNAGSKGGSVRSRSRRRDSRNGGSLSDLPNSASGSSTAKPG